MDLSQKRWRSEMCHLLRYSVKCDICWGITFICGQPQLIRMKAIKTCIFRLTHILHRTCHYIEWCKLHDFWFCFAVDCMHLGCYMLTLVGLLWHGNCWRRLDSYSETRRWQCGLPSDVEGVQDGKQCSLKP